MTEAPYPQRPTRDSVNSYQYDFSETLWNPDAAVALCNVPWDASYRDVARFATDDAKSLYFNRLRNDGQSIRLGQATILKYGEPIMLPIPFNTANCYNYIIVDSDHFPVTGQKADAQYTYYYFIQDVEYVAPNVTRFWVQIDVWQTYYERIGFNRCYVERGHVAIANENATLRTLQEYLTIPEGLDFGNEYMITEQRYWNFLDDQPYVIVVSTTDLEADYGTIENPNLKTATGGIYDNIPNGCNVYALSGDNFKLLMQYLSSYPWVSQGIIMLTLIPRKMLSLEAATNIHGIAAYNLAGVTTYDTNRYIIENMFDCFKIPVRYARLLKLYTSPYAFIEMTTLTGGEVVLKPECFRWLGEGFNAEFKLLSVVAPPHIRALVYPERYNSIGGTQINVETRTVDNDTSLGIIPDGDGLDIAVQLGNFPQFTLVNNQYINYLASTAHSRAYMFENAEWSFTKAGASIRLGFNQATNAMSIRENETQLLIGAMNERANIQQTAALVNGATGLVANAATGNAGGAVGAAVGAGVSYWQAGATANVNTALAAAQTANVNAGARYNRDTNKAYADYANQGDYQMAVQQIQSKVQDARLTQPSTLGQNGGEAFNLSNNIVGVLFKFKRIKDQFITTIGEYFLRYGYYVNTFMIPPETLATCTKFSYWKMHEIYLTASAVPELYKNAIRGIFQKGVTVWLNPDDIGVTDPADNLPLEGVMY